MDAVQETYRLKFNDLAKKAKKGKATIEELINFTESIPFESIRMVASMQVMKIKREIAPDQHFEFKIII